MLAHLLLKWTCLHMCPGPYRSGWLCHSVKANPINTKGPSQGDRESRVHYYGILYGHNRMVDVTRHYTFIQNQRIHNTEREPQGKLWALGDNVSM